MKIELNDKNIQRVLDYVKNKDLNGIKEEWIYERIQKERLDDLNEVAEDFLEYWDIKKYENMDGETRYLDLWRDEVYKDLYPIDVIISNDFIDDFAVFIIENWEKYQNILRDLDFKDEENNDEN